MSRFFADVWMLFPTEEEYIKVGRDMAVPLAKLALVMAWVAVKETASWGLWD